VVARGNHRYFFNSCSKLGYRHWTTYLHLWRVWNLCWPHNCCHCVNNCCRRVLSDWLNPSYHLKILQTYTASLVLGHSKQVNHAIHIEQSNKYLQGLCKTRLYESFLARLHLCNNMNKTSSKNIFYATRFLLLVSKKWCNPARTQGMHAARILVHVLFIVLYSGCK